MEWYDSSNQGSNRKYHKEWRPTRKTHPVIRIVRKLKWFTVDSLRSRGTWIWIWPYQSCRNRTYLWNARRTTSSEWSESIVKTPRNESCRFWIVVGTKLGWGGKRMFIRTFEAERGWAARAWEEDAKHE